MASRPNAESRVPVVGTGHVDYRLQRQTILDLVREGSVSRAEVCDAHPELLRVARNCAPAVEELCPICERTELVTVQYAFGPRLPPGGKTILSERELARIDSRSGTFDCYEIEVCPTCGWNHLLRRFNVGRR
ncbi:MAG TPA: hypothetical protein ENI86_08530 [Acidimicrobiales bacterium]|nr:hypothetical protein [Acidimicrobiales bacterium]